jgi:hypothetical protein
MLYSYSHPWDKSAQPSGQTDPRPTKNTTTNNNKKLNNKQLKKDT